MNLKPAKQAVKSPFLLHEDVITLDNCEEIILSLKNTIPNRNIKGIPIKTTADNQLAEIRLMPKIDDLLDIAEPYYGFKTRNILPFTFEWMAEGYKAHTPHTDSSTYTDGKWVQSKDVDFTIIMFLSTSIKNAMRDSLLESFGGDLEFTTHNFTITPKAGTLVMFPSSQHFLHTFSNISVGNLNYVRIQVTAEIPYKYDPKNFPGNMRTWFN